MIKDIDVYALSTRLSEELSAGYEQQVRDAIRDIADEDGKISKTAAATAEAFILRKHLEHFTTELIARVLDEIKTDSKA